MLDEDPSDAVALARMRAAAQVLRDAGLAVESELDAGGGGECLAAHLRRAVRWHRYSKGSASDLHRSCARDVARGALRLWAAAGGVPEAPALRPPRREAGPLRVRTQLARVQLSSQARTMCAALREDLSAQAVGLPRRGVDTFDQRVRREALRVAADLDDAVADQLTRLGLPVEPPGWVDLPVLERLPSRRRPGLENRLTTLVGTGFGAGVSLSVGRIAADLRPDWAPLVAVACGLLGLALTSWTVLARRLVAERAAAERWILETVASLRVALEERVLTRMLAAECACAGDTPNYRQMSRPR